MLSGTLAAALRYFGQNVAALTRPITAWDSTREEEQYWIVKGAWKMSKKKRVIPKFATEAEEVEWSEKNRGMIGKDLREAVAKGEAKFVTLEQLAVRLAARPVTIRLAEAHLKLAQKQAEGKGLPYQTYIRSLLHENSD